MDGLQETFEKVAKKQKLLSIQMDKSLDAMISNLASCKSNPENASKFLNDTKDLAMKLTESTRDYTSVLGKYSKAVDKKLKVDLDSVWDPKALEGKHDIMYQILLRHFVREGRFDLAKEFAKESGIEFEERLHSHFEGMFHIQEALRSENADLAIEWATENRLALLESGSTFEFNLHKLKFLSILLKGDRIRAVNYAQQTFPHFASKHINGII